LEIFTKIKHGSLEALVEADLFVEKPSSADTLLHQMLQALDYLSCKNIIHRDVKPANILYSHAVDSGYLYQLTDFGLANIVTDACTFAGSPLYMAPELEQSPRLPQTTKIDIWSLFVTLIWVMNVAGFRETMRLTTPQRLKAIQEAAKEKVFQPLREMAIVDPTYRASAAYMLDQLFSGEGRTHPTRTRASVASVETRPAAAVQSIKQGDTGLATGTKRPRQSKPSRGISKEVVAAVNRTRFNQLPALAVQTPVLGTLGARIRKPMRCIPK
jgi:serine/threonine protein kinase